MVTLQKSKAVLKEMKSGRKSLQVEKNSVSQWQDSFTIVLSLRFSVKFLSSLPSISIMSYLDECTSAVALDIEALLYSHCKKLGITLFTVSHRLSLFKYHEYILRFDGKGEWKFEQFLKECHEINFEIAPQLVASLKK